MDKMINVHNENLKYDKADFTGVSVNDFLVKLDLLTNGSKDYLKKQLVDEINHTRFLMKDGTTGEDRSQVTGDSPSDVLHPVSHRYEVVGRDFMTNQPIYRAVPVEFTNVLLKEEELENAVELKESLMLKLYHAKDSIVAKPVRDLVWDEREVFVPKVYRH